MLALRGARFVAVGQQDVHKAEPRLVTGRLVQQVRAVGELPQLLLLVIGERNRWRGEELKLQRKVPQVVSIVPFCPRGPTVFTRSSENTERPCEHSHDVTWPRFNAPAA